MKKFDWPRFLKFAAASTTEGASLYTDPSTQAKMLLLKHESKRYTHPVDSGLLTARPAHNHYYKIIWYLLECKPISIIEQFCVKCLKFASAKDIAVYSPSILSMLGAPTSNPNVSGNAFSLQSNKSGEKDGPEPSVR